MLALYCDICGQPIKNKDVYYLLAFQEEINIDNNIDNNKKGYNYNLSPKPIEKYEACKDCLEIIKKLLRIRKEELEKLKEEIKKMYNAEGGTDEVKRKKKNSRKNI